MTYSVPIGTTEDHSIKPKMEFCARAGTHNRHTNMTTIQMIINLCMILDQISAETPRGLPKVFGAILLTKIKGGNSAMN